jgi:hypothetical protein
MPVLRRLGAAILALSLVTGPAMGQSPALMLEGKVRQPRRLTFGI